MLFCFVLLNFFFFFLHPSLGKRVRKLVEGGKFLVKVGGTAPLKRDWRRKYSEGIRVPKRNCVELSNNKLN